MFTGIIEEVGKIGSIHNGEHSSELTVVGDRIFEDMHIGDSISVNGVCLTVTSIQAKSFSCHVMAETLRMSTLGILKQGSQVNLERAMSAGGRFGGHIVSGHIDGTGILYSMTKEDQAVWVHIKVAKDLGRYIILKGSIAIDGISLTVADVGADYFRVSIIPHTGMETTLLQKKPGELVNLECDVVGKYVERFVGSSQQGKQSGVESKIDMEFLRRNGF